MKEAQVGILQASALTCEESAWSSCCNYTSCLKMEWLPWNNMNEIRHHGGSEETLIRRQLDAQLNSHNEQSMNYTF